jgi:5-carboxymethyl-2-hydroxymuconate isomerase
MPHIVLEYSSDLAAAIDPSGLLEALHRAVGTAESFDLDRVKSRAIEVATYRVGAGPPRGFVHATVAFMTGRSEALRDELGRRLLEILVREVRPAGVAVSRSVEIRQFEPGMYFSDRE